MINLITDYILSKVYQISMDGFLIVCEKSKDPNENHAAFIFNVCNIKEIKTIV